MMPVVKFAKRICRRNIAVNSPSWFNKSDRVISVLFVINNDYRLPNAQILSNYLDLILNLHPTQLFAFYIYCVI